MSKYQSSLTEIYGELSVKALHDGYDPTDVVAALIVVAATVSAKTTATPVDKVQEMAEAAAIAMQRACK